MTDEQEKLREFAEDLVDDLHAGRLVRERDAADTGERLDLDDLIREHGVSRPLRADLPPLTERIARLPVFRGYPVPWFVAWLDASGSPVVRGQGEPDFRVIYPDATAEAHVRGVCWLCGGKLGGTRAFVVGPMCVVNRTSAEPPMHVDCAEWSVRGCPFLTRPRMKRREAGLPEETLEVPGVMLARNPGVIVVWVTKKYGLRRVPNGVLFDIGEPREVRFYAEGREATREEIVASIESGLPALRELAEAESPYAVRELEKMTSVAMELLPA